MDSRENFSCELTILMPCLNEAETVGICVQKAKKFLEDANIDGEVLVGDNGSTDGSKEIAAQNGARVIQIEQKGYGRALLGGIEAARGKFIIMGDADDSYDFSDLMGFVEKLRHGADLVMGDRFRGGIKPGAMPMIHKHFGNPVLSALGRLFFRNSVRDFHCGLRSFSKEAIQKLDLQTTGMEFASEMIVKASLFNMRIDQVPTILSPAGRSRAPHLRTWQDGWRHLRFLLLYSPRWLFLYPGAILMLLGLVFTVRILLGPLIILGTSFDIHTMLYSAIAIILGYQAIIFAVFTKVFAIGEGLLPKDSKLDNLLRYIKLEVGLLTGALSLLLGAGMSIVAFINWRARSFGPLDPRLTFRIVIPAVLFLILGTQTIFSSFFLSILGLGWQSRKN